METHKWTWFLIIANVIVFLLVFSMPVEMQDWVFQAFAFGGETMFEPWRCFTSLFLHASASHLFFNMVGLYFFGKILEHEVKSQWFLATYFVAGLLGNFIFMFTSPHMVVGASGAMFGVLGAAMLLNPVKRIHLYIFPLPLGIIAISFALFETLVVYFQPQEFSNVANISHVAGLLTGALFGFFYNPKRAMEGLLVLLVCAVLIMFLGPFLAIITGIGAFILQFLEMVIGFFLYNIAYLIGLVLWA